MSSLKVDDYALLLKSASGQSLRFSSTTDDPDELVTVEEFTTASGTGYESLTINFQRDPQKRYDDLDLLEEGILEGADGKVLFEGAITGRAPEAGRGLKITLTGHFSKFLDRDGVISEVIADRSLERWGGTPINRQVALVANNQTPSDAASEGGKIKASLPAPPWSASGRATAEGWYTAPAGADIASFSATYARTGTGWPTGVADYLLLLAIAADDAAAVADVSSNLGTVASGSGAVAATAAGRRFAFVMAAYASSNGTADSIERAMNLVPLVKGSHGLASITPSTVLKYLVAKYCPSITFDSDSIADHPYEILQLVFDNTDLGTAIGQLNAFANWNPAVWEGQRLHYGPAADLTKPDYILDPATRSKDATTISRDYPVNGVQVNFTDALTGRPERLLPTDDYRLRSDDDENPCNKQGRDRWGKLDVSFPCNADDCIQIGSVWLAEHLIPSRAGSAVVPGLVETANGQLVPAQNMRADEVARFADEEIGRPIMQTRHQTRGQVNTLTFSDAAATLDAILARIGVKVSLLSA